MDLKLLVAPYIGAPFALRDALGNGRSPAGWDCLGLAGWCRREFLGRETPGYDVDFPDIEGLTGRDLSRAVARHIETRSRAFRPVAPQAGAVVLLNRLGHRDHVGFALNAAEFLHVTPEAGTVITALDRAPWRQRLVGFFDIPDALPACGLHERGGAYD